MSTVSAATRRRGQPLVALAALLGGWVALRALAWMPAPTVPEPPVFVAAPDSASPSIGSQVPKASASATPAADIYPVPARRAGGNLVVSDPAPPLLHFPRLVRMRPTRPPEVASFGGAGLAPTASVSPALAGPLADANKANDPPGLPVPLARSGSRWSGDGWVLYRRGSGTQAAAGLFPSYGASQAGGVIRYALAPTSSRAPQAYLRASRAIDTAQSEGAAGLSLRPLPGVPARLLAEARVQRDGGRTRLRPAIAAISEVPPVRLPLGAQGELYAQAGYVGGTPATPFFDAQATIERALLGTGPAELRLGAGAWAGGQKGSARLDVGPRASVKLSLGEASSRLALDWRFRVAGNARPGSGPAVTFSAGF